MSPVARSDDSHDGRYTHPTQLDAPAADPNYPKMLFAKPYPKGDEMIQDTVIVQNADEEKEKCASGSWKTTRVWPTFAETAILICVLIGSLFAAPLSAQTLANHPTLSAAITNQGQNSVQLSSASNISVGDCLFGATELMQISTIPASGAPAIVGLVRGFGGTRSQAHASGEQVITGSCAAYFHVVPPLTGYSSCTRSAQLYIPWVDTTNGNVWVCQSGGTWTVTNARPAVTGSSFQYSQMFPSLPSGPGGDDSWYVGVVALLAVALLALVRKGRAILAPPTYA